MKTEEYYVWIIPEQEKVLVEDIGGGFPVGATEFKKFPTWEEARSYGDSKAKELGFLVEYDNWAGRYIEAMQNYGLMF